jgi:peroxiredoxin
MHFVQMKLPIAALSGVSFAPLNKFSRADCAPLMLASCLLTLATLPAPAREADLGNAAPDFVLPRRGGGSPVELANLKGRIVVLDFFAYWCAPCMRASSEVEAGIDQYYQGRQENAHGIEVQVLAINIEPAQSERTQEFIQRAGLKKVLDDLDGKVFQQYGGSAIPYVVIIDATGGSTGMAPAQVAYRKAGFEGVAKLRQVIDAIIQAPAGELARKIPPHAPGTAPARSGGAVVHKASVDFSTLRAPDILLTDEILEYRQTSPVSERFLSLTEGHLGVHYVPEFPLEQSRNRTEENFGFQGTDRVRTDDQITLLIGGGAYNGYMDYRSLWFDEHFRQLFSDRSGYIKAHPWGGNGSAGARWEYLPASGFVQGEVMAQHDVISPGYDVSVVKLPPVLERFRDSYDTLIGRLILENVLTSRLRALQELQATDTTDRQLRVSLQSSLNWAVTENWVGRFEISGTRESPRFESASCSAIVGRDWHNAWFLSLIARGYWDNGEVEDALLVQNTADPPLKTLLLGLEFRFQGRQSFVKLFAGPYFTYYEQANSAITTFPHLYQDRNWLSAQFAYVHEF